MSHAITSPQPGKTHLSAAAGHWAVDVSVGHDAFTLKCHLSLALVTCSGPSTISRIQVRAQPATR
jgi:hypothetical protein